MEPIKQEPVPQSAYDGNFWAGLNHDWWKFGADEKGKRISEGDHPKLILDTFGKDLRILDAGCGKGWLVKFLQELGADAKGIDYSEYAITHSESMGNCYLGSVTDLPFKDNEFDLIISREIFEHLTIEQAEEAFAEMVRVSSKWIYMTIWINHDKNASDEQVIDDFVLDPTHISYCTRGFWLNKFKKYIDEGIIVRREEKEKIMDWKEKGRCFVFEKVK